MEAEFCAEHARALGRQGGRIAFGAPQRMVLGEEVPAAEQTEVEAVLWILLSQSCLLLALVLVLVLGQGLPGGNAGKEHAEQGRSMIQQGCAETTHHDDLRFWLQAWCCPMRRRPRERR